MGESPADRLRMLEVFSEIDPQPESVPINCLMPMLGTPLADAPPVDIFDLVRLYRRRAHRNSPGPGPSCRRSNADHARRPGTRFLRRRKLDLFSVQGLLTAENPAASGDVKLLRELGLRIDSPETRNCGTADLVSR